MTAIILAIVTLGLLAHILHVVFTDDPARHRQHYRPPQSHPDDEFAAGAHHREAA